MALKRSSNRKKADKSVALLTFVFFVWRFCFKKQQQWWVACLTFSKKNHRWEWILAHWGAKRRSGVEFLEVAFGWRALSYFSNGQKQWPKGCRNSESTPSSFSSFLFFQIYFCPNLQQILPSVFFFEQKCHIYKRAPYYFDTPKPFEPAYSFPFFCRSPANLGAL